MLKGFMNKKKYNVYVRLKKIKIMRLLIYQANSLTTNIEIIGNLVVSNNRYYIIPIDTDMIVHNNYSVNNDNVFIKGMEIDKSTLKFVGENYIEL